MHRESFGSSSVFCFHDLENQENSSKMDGSSEFMILAGTSHPELANLIAKYAILQFIIYFIDSSVLITKPMCFLSF